MSAPKEPKEPHSWLPRPIRGRGLSKGPSAARARAWDRRRTTVGLNADDNIAYEIEWQGGEAHVYLFDGHGADGSELWTWRFRDDASGHDIDSNSFYETADLAFDNLIEIADRYYQGSAPSTPDTDHVISADQADTLSLEIEAFVTLWERLSPGLPLDPDSRRTGDALAVLASELAKTENPPRGVLREAFRWFAHKLDVFAEEAAKSAGSTAGKAGIVAGGLAASGQLPKLIDLANKVLGHLG